jgi:hypothetical protein
MGTLKMIAYVITVFKSKREGPFLFTYLNFSTSHITLQIHTWKIMRQSMVLLLEGKATT